MVNYIATPHNSPDRHAHAGRVGRSGRIVLACAAALASLTLAAGGALAANGTAVPATGKVAGTGYAGYLALTWQTFFAGTGKNAPCETLHVHGQSVAYLTQAKFVPETVKYTCTVPAGRPLYVLELSNECSTFKGDHGTFGTTGADLIRCARTLFKGARETTTVDGRAVDVEALVSATGVYDLHLHKVNPFGGPGGPGRSAAYGYGLLLTGLSTGTHTIHSVATIGTSKFNFTWTVHVK